MTFAKHALAVFFTFGCAMTAAQERSDPLQTCRVRSEEILGALQKGDYAAVMEHFDANMRAALNADELAHLWRDALPAQVGVFKRAANTSVSTKGVMHIAQTPLEFVGAWLNLRVACNADGSVGGLFFQPGTAPVAPAEDKGSTASAHWREQDLDTPSPLGPLPGTLTLPQEGNGPFPVAILLAGSGPQDRDETIGPNKPFVDIAHGLAEAGIASYRYDKRTRVYGAQIAGKTITVDDEVTDDAVAAIDLLAKQAAVDPARVFIVGNSLGALMAPRIAERSSRVAGIVLLASPQSFTLDTVLRQTRYIADVQHAPKEQTQAALAQMTAARDVIAKADPAHPPAGEFFHAPASYWLSLRDYRPIAIVQKLKQPALVLQGGRDYQVTPDGDFALWQAAFVHDPRVTLKLYPTLGHIFTPASDPPSPADYDHAEHVNTAVIADIAHWISAISPVASH
jgi:dienelactone hydrolase